MKIDELPMIVLVMIARYLNPKKQLRIQAINKKFYDAATNTQMQENVKYFTEGYIESKRLLKHFKFNAGYSRQRFIFGALYLAFNEKYKYNLHNFPQTNLYHPTSSLSEYMFFIDFQQHTVFPNFSQIEDFVIKTQNEPGDFVLLNIDIVKMLQDMKHDYQYLRVIFELENISFDSIKKILKQTNFMTYQTFNQYTRKKSMTLMVQFQQI